VPAISAIDKLEDILANSENFLQKMHELGAEPHQRKTFHRLFSPSEAAEMVGRDRTTLGRAEREIGMQAPRATRATTPRRLYARADPGLPNAFRHRPVARPGDGRAARYCLPELQGPASASRRPA